jgi:hypothetical protein
MNLLGRWFEEELLNSILPACQLTCYDRQADMIEFIRTSSYEQCNQIIIFITINTKLFFVNLEGLSIYF